MAHLVPFNLRMLSRGVLRGQSQASLLRGVSSARLQFATASSAEQVAAHNFITTRRAAEAAAMTRALQLAEDAYSAGEVPIGAVVLDAELAVVGSAHNETVARSSALCHAEILAMERAVLRLGVPRLDGCTLVVTLEPCLHCYGATLLHHLRRLVYAAPSPKFGAISCGAVVATRRSLNHAIDIEECGAAPSAERSALLMRRVFEARRTGVIASARAPRQRGAELAITALVDSAQCHG